MRIHNYVCRLTSRVCIAKLRGHGPYAALSRAVKQAEVAGNEELIAALRMKEESRLKGRKQNILKKKSSRK